MAMSPNPGCCPQIPAVIPESRPEAAPERLHRSLRSWPMGLSSAEGLPLRCPCLLWCRGIHPVLAKTWCSEVAIVLLPEHKLPHFCVSWN